VRPAEPSGQRVRGIYAGRVLGGQHEFPREVGARWERAGAPRLDRHRGRGRETRVPQWHRPDGPRLHDRTVVTRARPKGRAIHPLTTRRGPTDAATDAEYGRRERGAPAGTHVVVYDGRRGRRRPVHQGVPTVRPRHLAHPVGPEGVSLWAAPAERP